MDGDKTKGDPQHQTSRWRLPGGIACRNLSVYGSAKPTDYQKTFFNYPLSLCSRLVTTLFGGRGLPRKCILRSFEGVLEGGEMLLVLGRPGSGCTTLLKTLAGDTRGLQIDPEAWLNYQGHRVSSDHRGACTYSAEVDVHFPHLTVSQTLDFAAQAGLVSADQMRSERVIGALGSKRDTLTSLGLEHTVGTKVGDESTKGISGGERKRVSIAEVLLADRPLQCWDNSTRGLDSANALQFVRRLRLNAERSGNVSIATLYQASEDIYNCFDKVTLLYEGHEIFFGPIGGAKAYFEDLGFICPKRSSTADFLCSITAPRERSVQRGYPHAIPRDAKDFEEVWRHSAQRQQLVKSIEAYEQRFPVSSMEPRDRSRYGRFPFIRRRSPYRIGLFEQVQICTTRGFQRLLRDLPPTISAIGGNVIVSIILGSMFYNMPEDTSSFFGRGVLLFFTILTNTFLASFEGVQLWSHRPIVEKQFQLAFYRRSAEALASMVCDLPNKILLTAGFNLPFYFLANMRRTPGAFLTFYLFAFVSLLTGSMLYRTIGAMSRTLTASIAPGSDFILLLVIYTGFVIPIPDMHPWLRWFGYLNPVGYAFESLMINEFDGRSFRCVSFIPQGQNYFNVRPNQTRCTVTGSVANSGLVEGRSYLEATFEYYPDHLWRNLGIIFVITIFLCSLYLLATEYLSAQTSRGEILVFQRGQSSNVMAHVDVESKNSEKGVSDLRTNRRTRHNGIVTQKEAIQAATFVWDSLCYEVGKRGNSRKLLDDIEGWVEPGKLTALMGASGAGKTTLLNVLANRASIGVIRGEQVVDSTFQNEAFARKVGYAQQEDMAVRTATVREAMIFSARLRQPPEHSDAEKLSHVDDIIEQLDLTAVADAVIGVPGEGLNIEQRKRVTVGIELAARPELLLFLDEPTSGLDSNTAWSICCLLRKLADSGHAILCTIHQPSGTIFEGFDRLLFIDRGRSIYFGDIGANSRTVLDYFTRHGATECAPDANPAEWLMEITAGIQSTQCAKDWSTIWANSLERRRIKESMQTMKQSLRNPETKAMENISTSRYASSYLQQLYYVTLRNFQQDWRTPSYLYSKLFLTLGAGLVNGFSFYMSTNSLQGIQNQIFSVFLVFTLHSSLVQLIMPRFLEGRLHYETTERPSRSHSWVVFILSNVISELPSQTVLAIIQFITWFYPLGLYKNAIVTQTLHERSGLMFLLIWAYLLFSLTFSQMVVSIMPDAATGINISALLYSLSLIFCGVLVAPSALPRFWTFMYRATPITYFVNAIVTTGVAGVEVRCSDKELVRFDPADGETCSSYLETYIAEAGGRLLNPSATQSCEVCPVLTTDDAISRIGAMYEDRWRNLGIVLSYCIFNVAATLLLYWLFRVPKKIRDAKS